MSTIYTTTDVSINTDDILSGLSDDELLAEVNSRDLVFDGAPAFVTREQVLEAYEHCQRDPDMALTYIRQMSWAALGRIL